jgi:hypothetical protein
VPPGLQAVHHLHRGEQGCTVKLELGGRQTIMQTCSVQLHCAVSADSVRVGPQRNLHVLACLLPAT